MKPIDIAGNRFGRLTAVSLAVDRKRRSWACRCECGAETVVRQSSLQTGNTRSCGCLNREVAAERHTTHGHCGLPEFTVWRNMVYRCTSPKAKNYHRYGGRGIAVCRRWLESFSAFRNDVGPRPSSRHQIDRIDNDGDYEPGNVRWVTRPGQDRNTSRTRLYEFKSELLCLTDWSRRFGIARSTLEHRVLRLGWSIERALTSPVRGKAVHHG